MLIYSAKCRLCKNNCSPADYKGSRERRVGWAVGWRREVRLGCRVEEGRIGCGVCLLVIICCGYSELKKSLEEMAVKLTVPPAELVGTIQYSMLCCG